MPDFDSAIAKTIDAHAKVVAAAKSVGDDIATQRAAEQAESPVILPIISSTPPTNG